MPLTDHSAASLTFTVVIPVYNARRYLELTIPPLLEALRRVDGELVVMDNGSTDGSLDWLRANVEGARLRSAPELTIGGLRNAGAALGDGRVVTFIDADCVVPPDYFHQVQQVLATSGAEAVGSDYALPDEPLWIESHWHDLNRRRSEGGGGPVPWVPGGNFSCLREVFEAVGGFDESLITGEDTELCLRLRTSGATVWGSDRIEAKHLGNPKSLRGFFRKQRWHALGMFGTARMQWFDRPTLLTLVHILATGLGLVLVAVRGGTGVAWLVALTLLSPAVAVAFRTYQSYRPRSFWRALILFHLYLDARAAALGSILLRRSSRQ